MFQESIPSLSIVADPNLDKEPKQAAEPEITRAKVPQVATLATVAKVKRARLAKVAKLTKVAKLAKGTKVAKLLTMQTDVAVCKLAASRQPHHLLLRLVRGHLKAQLDGHFESLVGWISQ